MKEHVLWNKVTDLLPEDGKNYLVWNGNLMVVGNAQFYSEDTYSLYASDIKEALTKIKGRFIGEMDKFYFNDPNVFWAELPLAPGETNPAIPEPEYDSKDIYMKKDHAIIGLHAVGIAGPYEYDLVGIDGSTTRIKSDFDAIEAWVNEYDEEHNMLGRGSFRLSNDIESEAQYFEKEGWIRCEAPKKKEKV